MAPAPTVQCVETPTEEMGEGEPLCTKCRLPVTPENMFLKRISQGGAGTLVCKACRNAVTMMSRNFETMPEGWEKLSQEETVGFFRKLAQRKSEGPLCFQMLRTELQGFRIAKGYRLGSLHLQTDDVVIQKEKAAWIHFFAQNEQATFCILEELDEQKSKVPFTRVFQLSGRKRAEEVLPCFTITQPSWHYVDGRTVLCLE